MGIEKVLPTWRRPRGVPAAAAAVLDRRADEPLHLAVDRRHPRRRPAGVPPGAARQRPHRDALADEVGRAALHCIRCSACLNVCPVYERTGGHAYGSVYPGPIGAVLTPLLTGSMQPGHDREAGSHDPSTLPFASSLCGACYDACPVKIDIPSMLVHLRARHVDGERDRRRLPTAEAAAMTAAAWAMARRHGSRRASGPCRPGGCSPGTAPSAPCRRRCRAGQGLDVGPGPARPTARDVPAVVDSPPRAGSHPVEGPPTEARP